MLYLFMKIICSPFSAGLTVTVVNEGKGDVGLEAGALVLADQGIE